MPMRTSASFEAGLWQQKGDAFISQLVCERSALTGAQAVQAAGQRMPAVLESLPRLF